MKIFLTGASGYVGSVIAEKLRAKRFQVLGLARSEDAAAKLGASGIEPLRGDLNDVESLKKGAKAADAVIHTAFSHNFSDYDDAVKRDREAIGGFGESLAGTNKPLIVTSSSAVLGDTKRNEADEDYPFDQNSPRKSRGEAERDAAQLSSKGVRSIVLRLPLFVYGRGGSSFVPFLIERARKENEAGYVESGERKVSAVHVEDVADLYVLALETTTAKGLYNAAAETVTLKELSEAVARLSDVKAKSLSIEKAREQFGAMYPFLSINNLLDASKARRELGWSPDSLRTIADDIENGSYRQYKEKRENE